MDQSTLDAATTWLDGKPKRSAKRRGAVSTYDAKHVLEAETGLYVTDADFQEACRAAGVELYWPTWASGQGSPYVGIRP